MATQRINAMVVVAIEAHHEPLQSLSQAWLLRPNTVQGFPSFPDASNDMMCSGGRHDKNPQ